MKGNLGPAAIAGAVIVLALVIFAIYHFTFGSTPDVTAKGAPNYKQGPGGRPGYGPQSKMGTRPTAPTE